MTASDQEKKMVLEKDRETIAPLCPEAPPQPVVGCKAVVLAGTHSGSGKTTVTLALMAALKKRGLRVAPFKVGPDFIDPGHHRRVTGVQSRNLDGWMLSRETNREIFFEVAEKADIAVVEGVMGLYDGFDGKSEAGSTAQMAKWLEIPVVLVVDARSMARSAAAVVMGFKMFDPACGISGVIFNRVGSSGHLNYLTEALESSGLDIPVLGGLPRKENIAIPVRHLGLVTTEDHVLPDEMIDSLAALVEDHVDVDRFLESLPQGKLPKPCASDRKKPTPVVRVGVARDNAFCFYYPDNLELLEECGARLVYFSPIRDRRLPENLHGLYLGGGYPELFAQKLSRNSPMKSALRVAFQRGMPIYGECGGFMYLCKHLIDTEGTVYDMTGCFPFTTRMGKRRAALGYREIRFSEKTILGPSGMTVRGHEFHYSSMADDVAVSDRAGESVPNVYEASDKLGAHRGCPGHQTNRCLGSYVHLHFKSCPEIAENFVAACKLYKKEK